MSRPSRWNVEDPTCADWVEPKLVDPSSLVHDEEHAEAATAASRHRRAQRREEAASGCREITYGEQGFIGGLEGRAPVHAGD